MPQDNTKNLVIIGGGFSGTKLAKSLEKILPAEWEIYLLSKANFITYNPLLPEVVGASILPGHVQAPIRQMLKRTRIRMVTVDRIDFENRKVIYQNNETGELAFDHLVFASGVAANVNMMEGLSEHALPLKTVGDALLIRNKIIERLEQATIHPDPKRRKELTKFVVIGGGFSGVEVAGEIRDLLNEAAKYYKNVSIENCRVVVLHGTDRLLPELSEKLGKKTEAIFEKNKIEVHLNTRATKIEEETVVLKDGDPVKGATIICTIGTTAHHFSQVEELPLDRGRIVCQPDMSIANHDGIWALGDCALVPNAFDDKLCPPTAQFADRQAKALAKNIVAQVAGSKTEDFNYRPAGMLASIGHNNAVADIYGTSFSGLIAFFIWRGTYLMKIPTLSRKVRLFLEWTWAMFFPPDISHLGFKRTNED